MKRGKDKKKFWIIVIIAIVVIVVVAVGILFFGTLTGYGINGGTVCDDSDVQEYYGVYPRGDNIFVEGRTTRGSIVRIDQCISEKTLKEHYCRNAYVVLQKIVQCENRCFNGACI